VVVKYGLGFSESRFFILNFLLFDDLAFSVHFLKFGDGQFLEK